MIDDTRAPEVPDDRVGHDGEQPRDLLTRAEVAALFGVNPRTVTGWANGGRLESIRTLGGHRRYARDQVQAVLERQRRFAAEEDGPRRRPTEGG